MSALLIMNVDRYLSSSDYQILPVMEVYREGLVPCEVRGGKGR